LDGLVTIDGKQVAPPEQPVFPMGGVSNVCVTRGSAPFNLALNIPAPRSRKQPYAEPKAVLSSRLSPSIGYLKVTIFPGLIGIDVAREIDRAVAALAECDRLVLDLRGHLGGGLGVLRLMSYLTPGKLPIGYTLSRRRAEAGYEKEKLPRLDRLPSNKLFGIASLALKYAGRDPSVLLVSEGRGPQKWQGRIAIIVNEHTVSAGEMICAFARENSLATIVGTETAGRLIPGSAFRVGYGYLVIMPKAAYITWHGNRYEGRGIAPDVLVPWSPSDWASGRDNQLEEASKLVAKM
jgi:C-terminal processing protease CtpA/Prc